MVEDPRVYTCGAGLVKMLLHYQAFKGELKK
jgi:hypothetical protein